ncbi:succinate dehydrogenase/fumarate reductase iron-sulfur subunit [Thermodesulfobacteriota bacterium]
MSQKNGNTDIQYTFKIFRFDPDVDSDPYYDTFVKSFPRGTTVLEGLLGIQETDDDGIAFRFSCRSAVCGSCGMLVNGAPVLACRTQLASLIGDQVLVEPLPNMEIIKDLVVDMAPFWEAYRRVEPWLHTNGDQAPEKERLQSPAEVHKLDPYVNCILCASCYGACPVAGYEENYLGPAAIAKLFRYMQDTRDQRGDKFLERVDNPQGLWACHTIFRCIDACPKELRPTDTIEALRRRLITYRFKKFFRLAK